MAKGDDELDGLDLNNLPDLEDLSPKVLRKIIRSLRGKIKLSEKDEVREKAAEDEDAERKKKADLHAETKSPQDALPIEKEAEAFDPEVADDGEDGSATDEAESKISK